MKYKARDMDTSGDKTLLETFLESRGVSNITRYTKLNRNVLHDSGLLKNMKSAIDRLLYHTEKGEKIAILVDCDP